MVRMEIFKDKKKGLSGLIIVAMIIATVSSVVYLDNVVRADEPVQYNPLTYTDYQFYKEITINSSYVETYLDEFPILIHDNTTDLQTKIKANASDIAFFDSTKLVQYNHEIDYYNSTTGELWAWVNVTLSPSSDTTIYMYYRDIDGSYTIGHNPEQVWNSDYEAVWHMNGNSATDVDDSTANNNDVTGQIGTPTFNHSSRMGRSVYFGGDPDCLFLPQIAITGATNQITMSGWVFHINAWGDIESVLGSQENYYLSTANTQSIPSMAILDSGNAYHNYRYAGTDVRKANLSWYLITGVYDGSQAVEGLKLYSNKTSTSDGNDWDGGWNDAGGISWIGNSNASASWDCMYGYIDEARISTVERNTSWINASFDSQNETTGFLTLGAQQEAVESSFHLFGLGEGIITWSGTIGTNVWCNATGDTIDTAEINMTINTTDNITELRIYVADLNDTGDYINASNITLYISSDNSSYDSMGSFVDNGSNISINETTWPGGAGSNPFSGIGLTNTTTSIYLRFLLAIPVDVGTQMYYSISSSDWKVYIGTYL
jgi:hypothetical protein